MNRRQFISHCACCAFACAGASFLYNSKPQGKHFAMHHVGIHIAEHCNLSCKYCCHFSCIAQKEFYDLDKFKQDIDRMSFVFDKKLAELQLFGGEPLLNPQINKYIELSRQYFPKTRINIITNATLLDEMDKTFWETLNKTDTNIIPSIYPVKINWKSVLDKAEKYNVGIYGYYDCKERLKADKIEKYRRQTFKKIKLAKNLNSNINKDTCIMRPRCNNMYDGKLYPCTVIAYIRHFNKRFNTDFEISQNDYIDLYKINNLKEIEKFLSTNQFPFCKYCIPDFKEVNWETSYKHTIDEWT